MGVKTYTELQAELTFELGQRTDIASYTGAWINTAYLTFTTTNQFFGFKFPKYFHFPELDTTDATQSTTAGTAYLTTPTNAIVVYTIHDNTNDRKLSGVKFREFVEKSGRTTTSSRSKPTYWTRYGSQLLLYPTPDAAYTTTIYYRKKPALLSSGTDVTLIGSEWDEVILKIAVIQSMMRLKQYDTAAIEQKGLTELLAGKMDIYDQELRDLKKYFAPDYLYITYGNGL